MAAVRFADRLNIHAVPVALNKGMGELWRDQLDLVAALLPSREDGLARHQRCSASRFMPFISNRDALDKVARIAFSDRTSVMPLNGARASIAHASHRDAFDGVALGYHIDNLAAMGGIVAEADNVWHG